MQIPSIPTDNLYKFMAIAGIILLLFGATYPLHKMLDLKLRLVKNGTEISVTKSQAQDLKSDLKHQTNNVKGVSGLIDRLEKKNIYLEHSLRELKRKTA